MNEKRGHNYSKVWLRRRFIVDLMGGTVSHRHLEGTSLSITSRLNGAMREEG